MSLVSLTRVHENTTLGMKLAIAESLNLINCSLLDRAKRIVIKANLCYYWDYTTGQTTDPRFLAALINLIREKNPNAEITVVESDASAMKCKYSFKMLGYEKLARDLRFRLVNLTREPSEAVSIKIGKQSMRLLVPRIIQEADLRINVTKIKYAMEPIKITCALKNIFGCNAYPRKFRYHPLLGETIIAANKAMKFDLCIIDGNIVSGIQPRRLGLVMASLDPVAIDAAAAKIAGLNPHGIKYLQLAQEENIGRISFAPVGAPLSYFRDRYPARDIKKKLMGMGYSVVTRVGLGKRLGLD